MHEREFQVILKKLTHIAQNVSEASTFRKGARRSILLAPRNVPFCLVDNIADEYEDVRRQLLQQPGWQARFSERYIEIAIQPILGTLVAGGDATQAGSEFSDLIARLDTFSEERVVYVPLDGIVTQVGRIEFGRVALMDKAEAISTAENVISKQLGEDATATAVRMQQWRQHVLPQLTAPTYAEFRAIAEFARARERAEEETRRVLDLLRYFIMRIHGKQADVAIGLQGEVHYGTRETPVIRVDGLGFDHSSEVTHLALKISPQTVAHFSRFGVLDLAALLRQDRLTDFEETLLRGVHWYADALTQVESENEFLSLTTCLETFLNPGSGEPITNAIAEGVAVILGKSLQERKSLKRQVRGLYGQRSGVSHGGRKGILDVDLAELRDIAGNITGEMIRRKDEFSANGKRGLLEWIEDEKLALPTDHAP